MDKETIDSQNKLVKEALLKGKRLNLHWAYENGICRLAARIHDLRHKQKMKIKTKRVKPEEGNSYGEYYLA